MELNPSHKVTSGLHDHWHKILALVMQKQKLREVLITPADIAWLAAFPSLPTVIAHDTAEGLKIIFCDSEREALSYLAEHQKKG